MTTHRYGTIQDFITTLSKVFNRAFQSPEVPPGSPVPVWQGMDKWLRYCSVLKPFVFSYRDRPQQVHFQALTLDQDFKATAGNSLAVIVNYPGTVAHNRFGQVHLMAELFEPPAIEKAGQQLQPTQGKAVKLLDGTVQQHRLLIEPQHEMQKLSYQAKVMPMLPPGDDGRNPTELFEPLAVFLVRLMVSGVGLDFRQAPLESLLRGYEGADCIQHLLVCHVSQQVTSQLAEFTDAELCTLKYRRL